MADIARSVDYFSKDNGLKYEKDPIIEVSKKTPMPKDFLKFFTNLVGFISQYNNAFKEENFNRMGQLIVTINDSIERYFKSDAEDLKPELKKISDNTTEEVLEYFKDKAAGHVSSEEAAEQIEDIISKFKTQILERVKAIVFKQAATGRIGLESEDREKEKNKDGDKFAFHSKTAEAVVNEVNKIVEKKNHEFEKNVQIFSIKTGKLIVSEFSNSIKKLTDSNLKSFQKGVERMNKSFASQFYGLVSSTNSNINQAQSRFKSLFSGIFRGMKYSAITVINVVSATVTALAATYLTGKLIFKTLLHWGGVILKAAWGIVKLGIKLVTRTIGLVFKGVKLIAMGVMKVTGFMFKTAKKVIGGVFSLANTIFKKISGFSILGAMKGALKAFLFSYPGAFFLGYVCGKIWKSILKLAGVSDEDIAAGRYSIFKDNVSNSINEAKEKIKNFFGDKRKSLTDLFNEKMDAALKSDTFNDIKTQLDSLKETVTGIIERVKDIYEPVANFIESYVWPVAKWVAIALAIITGEAIQFPKAFIRTHGAISHGLQTIMFFAKHPRLRGGLAGILAGATLLGASMVLSSGPGYSDENKNKDNNEDQDNPLKLPIQKKYAALYGYTGKTSDEESKGPRWDDFTPQIDLDKQYLGRLSRIVRNASPADRELLRRRYDEVRAVYRTLMDTRNALWDYHSTIETLQDDYKKNPKEGWTILNYPDFISKIVYDENGELLYDPKNLENKQVEEQLTILNGILAERLNRTNARLREFKDRSENETDPFSAILGRSEEWKNEKYEFRTGIFVNGEKGPEETPELIPLTDRSTIGNYSYNSDIFNRITALSPGPLVGSHPRSIRPSGPRFPRISRVVPVQPNTGHQPPSSPPPSAPSISNPQSNLPSFPTMPSIEQPPLLYTNAPTIQTNNLPHGAQNFFEHTFNLLKLIVSRFQTSFIELVAKKNNAMNEISKMTAEFNFMIGPYIAFKLNAIDSFNKVKELAIEKLENGEIRYNITTAAYRIFDQALSDLIISIERHNPQRGLEKTVLDFWRSMTLNPNDLKTALMNEYRNKFSEEIERNKRTQETIERWLKKLDDNLT